MRLTLCLVGTGLIAVGLAGCAAADATEDDRTALLEYEEALTSGAAQGAEPVHNRFGEDPFRIRCWPELDRCAVLLRNRDCLVLTDLGLRELARHPAPAEPTALIPTGENTFAVAGPSSSHLAVFTIDDGQLQGPLLINLPLTSIRDLAFDPATDRLYVLDNFDNRLLSLAVPDAWRKTVRESGPGRSVEVSLSAVREWDLAPDPLQVRVSDGYLMINHLASHQLWVIPLEGGQPDFEQRRLLRKEGPWWGFDVVSRNGDLLLFAAGVEDRPLNRSEGEFGNIDSFLWVHRMPKGGGDPETLASVNLSESGVVTPKVVRVWSDGPDLRVVAIGFGSDRMALLSFDGGGSELRDSHTVEVDPGITDLFELRGSRPGRLYFTSVLTDSAGWLDGAGGIEHRIRFRGPTASDTLLGELLFFTTLMTPHNRSDGSLSRFTCETCHFEGDGDGRVHYTGRGEVHTTTRTVRGLAGVLPLFSRGGDQTLSSMVQAEFRAANQFRKGRFSVREGDLPWLDRLGRFSSEIGPLELRRALLRFFVDLEHRPNPERSRGELSGPARQGLDVFALRCSGCHRPLPSTRLAWSASQREWPAWLTRKGVDLVWGSPFLMRVGVEPAVDPAGARVPSLRRVWRKYPYFTTGSARSLDGLLSRFRYSGDEVWHDGTPPKSARALSDAERKQLLELLRYF